MTPSTEDNKSNSESDSGTQASRKNSEVKYLLFTSNSMDTNAKLDCAFQHTKY